MVVFAILISISNLFNEVIRWWMTEMTVPLARRDESGEDSESTMIEIIDASCFTDTINGLLHVKVLKNTRW